MALALKTGFQPVVVDHCLNLLCYMTVQLSWIICPAGPDGIKSHPLVAIALAVSAHPMQHEEARQQAVQPEMKFYLNA